MVRTEVIAKGFEPGWDWWAWPVAWTVFIGCGLIMGNAAPLLVSVIRSVPNNFLRRLAASAVVGAAVTSVVLGWAGSGILMRHQETGPGVLLVFLGSIVVAGISWYCLEDRHRTIPVLVVSAGAVVNGIGEIITRTAASVPAGVGQVLGVLLVGALIVNGYLITRGLR
ncbi:hypothetical protein ABH924_004816 [Arthrobacter sp. GAS37]|uniref:hypothetical protein n=1 Tax=Arthrobacter sp. GAS37 TaxID=3156261 RepID=UPI0038395E23